jgi:hypothetical protein
MGNGGEGGTATAPTRLRRPYGLGRDDDAAAGVVTILLSILIIILVITLITSVWMPVWMEDKESAHMRVVTSEFGHLKATIDNQILRGNTNFVIASPVTLGTEGFSLFGADTTGTFSINYFRGDVPDYQCNIRSENGDVNVTSTGGMKYISNNMHYVNQQLSYENGAVILNQGDGQVIRVAPQLIVEDLGPVSRVSFILISVSGKDTAIQGVGTVLVKTQLITYTDRNLRFTPSETLYVNVTTEFPLAWTNYFNMSLKEAGLVSGTDFNISFTDNNVTLAIDRVQLFDMAYALVKVELESTAGSTRFHVPQGTVGMWRFNEGVGNVAKDSSEYTNHGTLMNGTSWTTGVAGTAAHFDGFDDYVRLPDDPELNPTQEVTVEAWVRWTIDPAAGIGWANIFNKGGDRSYELQHNGDNGVTRNDAFEFAVNSTTNRTYVFSNTTPAQGVWFHVVGVYSSIDEELAIYINGTKENSTYLNGTINLTVRDPTIGCRNRASTRDRHFQGDIDEVVVYNRRLTDSEIMDRYLENKP